MDIIITCTKLTTMLLIGFFIDITFSSNTNISTEYRLKGDYLILSCPMGTHSFVPIWTKDLQRILTDNNITIDKDNNLYGRIQVNKNNQTHVIEIEKIMKEDTGTFCCTTSTKNVVQHCTQVVIFDEGDIKINETDDDLICSMENQSDISLSSIFTYSWRHYSFSGHHLECDDVDGQSFHLKKTSPRRLEGKYICTVQYSNKSNGNGIDIGKSHEIKQNENLSCKGDAKIEYSTKRKSIVISFLVQSSNVMNQTWKQNSIDLTSSKFVSNVRIIKDAVTICNKSVEVTSTDYRLEIRDVVATDINQSYTLVVTGSKDNVSCSHYLNQKEIDKIGDKNKITNVLSYYILVCFCLAMLFGASALLISLRRKAKRRQNVN